MAEQRCADTDKPDNGEKLTMSDDLSDLHPDTVNPATLVERVARAMCKAALGGKQCPCTGKAFGCADSTPGHMARAALREIVTAAGGVDELECSARALHDLNDRTLGDFLYALAEGGSHD